MTSRTRPQDETRRASHINANRCNRGSSVEHLSRRVALKCFAGAAELLSNVWFFRSSARLTFKNLSAAALSGQVIGEILDAVAKEAHLLAEKMIFLIEPFELEAPSAL